MVAARTTIAFGQATWPKLKKAKNKSKIVNTALEYYFSAQEYLKEKEEEFILWEFAHFEKTGESYSYDETFK